MGFQWGWKANLFQHNRRHNQLIPNDTIRRILCEFLNVLLKQKTESFDEGGYERENIEIEKEFSEKGEKANGLAFVCMLAYFFSFVEQVQALNR